MLRAGRSVGVVQAAPALPAARRDSTFGRTYGIILVGPGESSLAGKEGNKIDKPEFLAELDNMNEPLGQLRDDQGMMP